MKFKKGHFVEVIDHFFFNINHKGNIYEVIPSMGDYPDFVNVKVKAGTGNSHSA